MMSSFIQSQSKLQEPIVLGKQGLNNRVLAQQSGL